jgi:hypothetical protein
VRAQTSAFPGPRTKKEHFLDRLRRSWHSHLQWEKWRRRSGPALPNSFKQRPHWPSRPPYRKAQQRANSSLLSGGGPANDSLCKSNIRPGGEAKTCSKRGDRRPAIEKK